MYAYKLYIDKNDVVSYTVLSPLWIVYIVYLCIYYTVLYSIIHRISNVYNAYGGKLGET